MTDRWIWVSLHYATFAIHVKDGKVVDTGPYMWKLIHKVIKSADEEAVADYLKRRGAYIEEMEGCPHPNVREKSNGGNPWIICAKCGIKLSDASAPPEDEPRTP